MGVRTLPLPRLVAGRDYADDMVSTLGTVVGQDVVVDAENRARAVLVGGAHHLPQAQPFDEELGNLLIVCAAVADVEEPACRLLDGDVAHDPSVT